MPKHAILLIDDDESLRRVLEYSLQQSGFQVEVASRAEEGLERFRRKPFDVVITDILMPGIDGIELLQKIKKISREAIVIVITAHGTVETAIRAMKLGAYDYLTKPFTGEQLRIVVERALRTRALITENRYLRQAVQERFQISSVVGSSRVMKALFQEVSQVAGTDTSVLITGESGTGKELIAKAIYIHGRRKYKPFVVVNCGAIPDSLLESELFGHTLGAFTGAVADKKGKIEAADGGTVFFDEIAELPIHLQSKLLRVLQEGQVDKIGAVHPLTVDIRFISATNRDLELMIREKTFRMDLYYRLNIIPIQVPPLRERKDDIPLLTEHFLRKYSAREGRPDMRLAGEVIAAFEAYSWPGNVRELENLMERMVVMNRGNLLTVDHLPAAIRHGTADVGGLEIAIPEGGVSLEEVEKMLILRALQATRGNQTRAAKFLGITRNTLLYRMGKHGIGA